MSFIDSPAVVTTIYIKSMVRWSIHDAELMASRCRQNDVKSMDIRLGSQPWNYCYWWGSQGQVTCLVMECLWSCDMVMGLCNDYVMIYHGHVTFWWGPEKWLCNHFPTVTWPTFFPRVYVIFWWSGDAYIIFSHGHMTWFFLLAGNIRKIPKKS